MDKKMAREIVESLPSLYPSMSAEEEEAIWAVLATDKNVGTSDDCISRQAAIDIALQYCPDDDGVCSKAGHDPREMLDEIEALPPAQPEELDTLIKALKEDHQKLIEMQKAQPEVILCKDCKFNPKYEWFGCPMSHLSEKQRHETAWCWKAERRC